MAAKAKRPVQDYISAKNSVMEYFKCDGDYYIRPLMDYKWTIKGDDEYFILSYWKDDEKRNDAVIVKKGGDPMIFKAGDHTMIVGIDCVKIAFIFHNANKK